MTKEEKISPEPPVEPINLDPISPESKPSTSTENNSKREDQFESENHHVTGLTPSEKIDLDRAIYVMRKNVFWKSPAGELVFHAAKDKIRKLLLAADSRLTKVERIEIGLRIEDIIKVRHCWISSETKREKKESGEKKGKKRRKMKKLAVVVSLILKSAEMVADSIVFFQEPGAHSLYPSELLFGFNSFAIAFTGCFLIFYAFCYIHVDKEQFSTDCVSCLIFAIVYFFLMVGSLEFEKSLVAAATVYLIDMCFKKYVIINDNSPETRYTPYVSSSITYPTRSRTSRVNSSKSTYYSARQDRVRPNNFYTNECFVNDLPAGINYTLNFKNMDNSYQILDLLHSADREADVHPNFSEHIATDNENV